MSERNILAHIGINISGIKANILKNEAIDQLKRGNFYGCEVHDTAMGDGDIIGLGFKTPAETVKKVHLFPTFASAGAAHLTVYEGANWSGGLFSGEISTINNRSRSLKTASSLLINHRTTGFEASGSLMYDLTGLNKGTAIYTKYSFASVYPVGSRTIAGNAIILSGATKYYAEVETDAESNGAQLDLEWYEQDA